MVSNIVIPAEAGISCATSARFSPEIPASAGMTAICEVVRG
jgi:hypothetical protein